MHDAVVVQVRDGGDCCADKICGIAFKVAALATDAIEELAAESEIGYEVDCSRKLDVVFRMVDAKEKRNIVSNA